MALAAGLLGGLSVLEINVLARGFADTPEGAQYLEATQQAAAAAAAQAAAPEAAEQVEAQETTRISGIAGASQILLDPSYII